VSAIDVIHERLARGDVILLDGGMGTEIQARGVPMDEAAWSAVANVEHPEIVRGAHEDFIRAGADVIIANSYAAGRGPLANAGNGDRVEEINRAAVALALEARENAAEGPVAVAGSLSDMMVRDVGRRPGVPEDGLLGAYREQASILAESGVDFLVLEMMRSPTRHLTAVEAALETGLPVWLGLCLFVRPEGDSVANDVPFEDSVEALVRPGVSVVSVMHTNVDLVDEALAIVGAYWDGPLGAYPHTGTWHSPLWEFDGLGPDELAAEAYEWVARGVQVVGGCCGVRPEHIRKLKETLPPRVPFD
jgi:S-methylmethionine-dependent homocysteine/selenocysteine methylase